MGKGGNFYARSTWMPIQIMLQPEIFIQGHMAHHPINPCCRLLCRRFVCTEITIITGAPYNLIAPTAFCYFVCTCASFGFSYFMFIPVFIPGPTIIGVPVHAIFFTAATREFITGWNYGADDYILTDRINMVTFV